MSLISAKNLLAPLKNKVHIVTIILCAIAFAVLRMSGASISTSKRTYTRKPPVVTQQRVRQEQARPAVRDNSRSLVDIEKELGL